MSHSFKITSLCTTLILSTLLSACGQDSRATAKTTEQTTVKNIQTEDKEHNLIHNNKHTKSHSHRNDVNPDYIIATDPSNDPFELVDENGMIHGLDAEIINAIAENQDFTYNFKGRKWQGIFKEIEENKSDLISGIIVATDARRKKYDFTDPIFIKKRYAYLTNDTAKKNSVSDFSDICALKVAVKDKTDKSALYHSVCGETNPNFVPVSSNYTAFEYLVSGKVEVAIGDDVLYNYLIKDHNLDNIVSIADPDNKEIILAWPTQKGNTELLNKFNAGLANIKQDGTYEKLVHKWLGKDFEIRN